MEVVKQLGSNVKPRNARPYQTRALSELPPPPSASGWYIAYLMVGALACLTAVTLFVVPSERSIQRTSDDSSALQSYTDRGGQVSAESSVRREQLTHYTAIAHELDRLVARANVDPEGAIDRFREIYAQFTREWVAFPRQALERAGINIAEFMVRLDEQGLPPNQVTPLLAVAGTDPDRLMLAAGVLDVTLNSPGLGQITLDQLRAIRAQMTDAPFRTGTNLSLSIRSSATHLATEIATDEYEWWARWHQGIERTASPSSTEHTSVILLALGNRLRAQEPADQSWRKTSSLLVRSLGWREGSPERFWLIEQFSDSDVETPRLAMLTEVLVTESAADGVDQLMILDRNANDPKREQIRMRIQDAWFPARSTSGSDELVSGSMTPLMNQLRVQINATPDSLDDEQAIEHMLRLARLVTAAELQLQGVPELSEEIILGFDEPLSVSNSEQSSLARTDADTDWAEKAVNCTEPGQLRPYLDELIGKSTIGISSAYALVHIGKRADAELRTLALEQITRFGDQVTMLIAVENALQARPSSKIEAIVSAALQRELPSRSDPDWLHAVRRELMSSMGRAITDERATRVTRLQEELAELHALRFELLMNEKPGDRSPSELLRQLADASSVEFAQQVASSSIRDQLRLAETRLILHRSRAQTPMHEYLAEQRFLFTLKRLHLPAHHPETERLMKTIQEDLTERDGRAVTVLQQITQTQRAIAAIALIELERGQGR